MKTTAAKRVNPDRIAASGGNEVTALVLENHICEIAGKRLDLKKGEKINLTPFQFQVLSSPNLANKIVAAV